MNAGLFPWPDRSYSWGPVASQSLLERRSRVSWFLWLGILFSAGVGCGGNAGHVRSAREESAGADQMQGGSDEDAVTSPLLDCGNGTCQRCGSGICPEGSYCDESASGGPACSWIPECVDTIGCDCLLRVLGSHCECDERDGGAYVSCR